jgi:hypothetical protein
VGVPLAQMLINETGITLTGPPINLIAEDSKINWSGPPIFPSAQHVLLAIRRPVLGRVDEIAACLRKGVICGGN